MKTITHEILQKFFQVAAKSLTGDWVILGGSVLPGLGHTVRPTVDIDLAGKNFAGGSKQLELMQIAEAVGLPVESINTAAEFFLRKIPNFEQDLVPLFSAENFKVYRPNVNLFLKLKIHRLSESDLADCLEFLVYARSNNESIRNLEILAMIDTELVRNDGRLERLGQLKKKIADLA